MVFEFIAIEMSFCGKNDKKTSTDNQMVETLVVVIIAT